MARYDESDDDDVGALAPPTNFAMVERGLYRSGFPKKKNFDFLRKLNLRTVLTLVLEDYPAANLKFMREHGIQLLQVGVAGNKEPFVDMPEERIILALQHILDDRNHPMLIHCNKGKHRTGSLVGCLRRVQQWSLTSVFEEYMRHSRPKARFMDQQFIELFDPARVRVVPRHVPAWMGLEVDFAAPPAPPSPRALPAAPQHEGARVDEDCRPAD